MKVRKFRNARKALAGLIVTAVALTAIALVAGSSGHGHGWGNPHFPPPPPPPQIIMPPIVIQPVVVPNVMDSYNKQISNISVAVDSSNNLLIDTSGSLYSAMPPSGCGCWWQTSDTGALLDLDVNALMTSNVNTNIWVSQDQS
ncbi:MAG: hypothetical protein HY681_00225 [Chloroflexi bacterium]|nr:hypothetical protein [Chloroflexota bacterium]